MERQLRRIQIDEETTVSSVWAVPEHGDLAARDAVILAPGAGADMNHPFLSYYHEGLAEAGFSTVKFNFPYKEAGRKAPDPQPKLEATYRQVIAVLRDGPSAPRRIFIGGKSLGGRIATHLAAQGEDVAGLVLLGYPLHRPGRTDRLRDQHLSRVRCPALFLQGTRDALCQLDLLRRALDSSKFPADLHVVEGADHSFHVLKRSGRSDEQVREQILKTMVSWLRGR